MCVWCVRARARKIPDGALRWAWLKIYILAGNRSVLQGQAKKWLSDRALQFTELRAMCSLWNVCDCTSSMLGEGRTLRHVTRAQLIITLSLLFFLMCIALAPVCSECRDEKSSGMWRLVVGRWVWTFQKYLLPPSWWWKMEATGSSETSLPIYEATIRFQ